MKYCLVIFSVVLFFLIDFASTISADGNGGPVAPISCYNSGSVGDKNGCPKTKAYPCQIEYWDSIDRKNGSAGNTVTPNISTSELDQCFFWIKASLDSNPRYSNPKCYFKEKLIDCYQSPSPKPKVMVPVNQGHRAATTNSQPKLLSWIDKLFRFFI